MIRAPAGRFGRQATVHAMPKTVKVELLKQAADVAFAGVGRDTDISRFSRPRQVFITVYSAQGVIDNGGFRYFFESDWPGQPPYSRFSDAYREIGAADVAHLIDRAASLFGISDLHRHRAARLQFLNEHGRNEMSELVRLGDKAIDQSEGVFRLLEDYVRLHADHFDPAG
jgi:hypothetical protein